MDGHGGNGGEMRGASGFEHSMLELRGKGCGS